MKPDATAQFRPPKGPPGFDSSVYMGGTAMSCGQHPTLPKRHRWGRWRVVYGGKGRERICRACSLVSDTEWIDLKKGAA